MDRLDKLEKLLCEVMDKLNELEKPEKLVYNVSEAAEVLCISRRHVYDLMNQADFPASLKLGSRRLISRELLAEWVREQAGK